MPGFPPMGSANPANLEQLAAAGDPRAIALLQQLQAQGGGAPGGAPAGPPGGMPPMGPAGAAPPMSQSDFSGYGSTPSPSQAAQALKAQQLIQLLRQHQR